MFKNERKVYEPSVVHVTKLDLLIFTITIQSDTPIKSEMTAANKAVTIRHLCDKFFSSGRGINTS